MTSTAASRLAPGRSCAACRRRKIRCDRQRPCSYCTRLELTCTYSDNAIHEKRQSSVDVASRLTSIESSLARLDVQVSRLVDALSSGTVAAPGLQQDRHKSPSSQIASPGVSAPATAHTRALATSSGPNTTTAHYTGHETTELQAFAQSPAPITNSQHSRNHHQLFLLHSMGALAPSLQHMHPSREDILVLWEIFTTNVDPLIKMVHIPSTHRKFVLANEDLVAVPPDFESLMFSVYFAAVSSTQSSTACLSLFGQDEQVLLDRYRLGVEQALARADFMTKPTILTLQALILYLTCARQSVEKSYIWSMMGLAIRLATKLGLHHDPAKLGLTVHEVETRRRLWWQLVILDVRTAEENDTDPLIYEYHFDTQLPSRINDAELETLQEEPTRAREQCDEMLFTLSRIEISYTARQIVFSDKFNGDNGYTDVSGESKSIVLHNLKERLQTHFWRDCDMTVPLHFITVTSGQMVLAKLKLTLDSALLKATDAVKSPQDYQSLVQNSMAIIEYAQALRSDSKYSRFTWLWTKYVEWDACAVLLQTLFSAPTRQATDRAWKVVDVFFTYWEHHVVPLDDRWMKLQSLRDRARNSDIAREARMTDSGQNTVPTAPLISYQDPLFSARAKALDPAIQGFASEQPSSGLATQSTMPGYWPDQMPNATPGLMEALTDWELGYDADTFRSWL